MREIAVVTVSRSDFGCYLSLLKAIQAHPNLCLRLIVSGSHLSSEYGLTVKDIEAAGFGNFERIETLLSSDTPEGIAKSMGIGVQSFGQLYSQRHPDILVLLGDRFDMLPAGLAAMSFRIPIAHLHGGEVTEGAMDEAIRHALSKMSHLHFVSTEQHAARLCQMGEEEWRIQVSGAPALDSIAHTAFMSPEEIRLQFGIDPLVPCLLVTYHPVTLEAEKTKEQITNLLSALSKCGVPCIFTYPNADTNGRVIIEAVEQYCKVHPQCRVVKNIGQRGYWSLMRVVSAMVGNSSSGIIESPSFRLPVVNIGNRQKGRMLANNVISTGYGSEEIYEGLARALNMDFKSSLHDLKNPFGDGYAGERIAERLAAVELGAKLIIKRFVDRN